jgi:NUMOD3 motif
MWGKHHSEETKEKLRLAAKQRKGYRYTKGRVAWNKGKHNIYSPETIEKLRVTKLGNLNPMWKGDSIQLNPLHRWVRRRLPTPDKCQTCNKAPAYDLANITGTYNRDLSNWKYLCRRCHMLVDNRLKNLRHFSVTR